MERIVGKFHHRTRRLSVSPRLKTRTKLLQFPAVTRFERSRVVVRRGWFVSERIIAGLHASPSINALVFDSTRGRYWKANEAIQVLAQMEANWELEQNCSRVVIDRERVSNPCDYRAELLGSILFISRLSNRFEFSLQERKSLSTFRRKNGWTVRRVGKEWGEVWRNFAGHRKQT